ncbi:MAG: asparaginase [Hyphomicrobiaceae bacterium]
MRNPILIELTRGALVESAHAGVVALARADGGLVAAIGDAAAPVFPRSAIKPLQALPFLETGAVERFGLGPAEIAVACASHSGTPRHVAVVEGLLAKAGMTPAVLGCGVHESFDAAVARDMIRRGERPTSLHHNCSGKHAAMLATAAHLGEPTDGYWLPDHPVQVRIRRVLEDMTGCSLTAEVCGIDGCSVPNWAMPPAALAGAFARFVSGVGMVPQRARDCARIFEACTVHPDLVAGPGRFDTLVMQRLPGRVLVKTGAEGVYCGALRESGLGFALKIDDGAKRASEAVAAHVIARFHPEAQEAAPDAVLRNWRGIDVGRVRATPDFEAMLAACTAQ